MTDKKFYKTIITVEVLSEDPYQATDLDTVNYDITSGDCSGSVSITSSVELTGEEMAKELIAQGSDPDFFQLGDEDDEEE